MALVPSAQYPSQIDTDPAYPQGKARNAGSFQDGTGTPLEKAWVNDLWGFLQALLASAGITPSGSPDQVGASQYLQAVQAIATAAQTAAQTYADKAVERSLLANWEDGGELIGFEFNALAWIPGWGKFLTVGSFADTFISADGKLWTQIGDSAIAQGIAGNAAGTAVVVESSIRTSTDQSTWTTRTNPSGVELQSVAWSSALSLFIAVGQNGAIITSPTGVTWTNRTSGTADDLFGVGASPSLIVAVGENGRIVTSPNGTTWTLRTSGVVDTLSAVDWSPTFGLFVASGANGRILTSPDGITWTIRTSGTSNGLGAQTPTDNFFIIAGTSGMLLFSANGIDWRRIENPSDSGSFSPAGAAWSGDICVLSGGPPSHGRVCHSLGRLRLT